MEAMQHFDKINKIKLTWADVLFNDEKMDVSSEARLLEIQKTWLSAAAQIRRRILAIKGKLVDKKVIFAIRVTTDFETFVLSPPLKKTILLIPT